jgi:hypothetical protein
VPIWHGRDGAIPHMVLKYLGSFAVMAGLFGSQALAAGKIFYGSRVGMTVTIKSMSGLDTSHAVIQTEHTRDDAIGFCRDYALEDPVTDKCVEDELAKQLSDTIYANCPRGIFTDFGGDKFQFKGKKRNPVEFGPKYVLKDLRTGEIADDTSASGYDVNMDIFRALCPRTAPPKETDRQGEQPSPTSPEPGPDRSSASASTGFIFAANRATNPWNRKESIRLFEKLPVGQLKKRFARYKVHMTAGEDCNICGTISRGTVSIDVDYDVKGIAVVGISSNDNKSTDALGNTVGTALAHAIGSHSAYCDAGDVTTCASPRLDGLYYIVEDNEKCPLDVKENQPTDVPDCARIGGFRIGKAP